MAIPNDKLKKERKRRGWTQKYIAECINLGDTGNFGRWERGTAFPQPHYVQSLAKLFGKEPEELGLIRPKGLLPDSLPGHDEPHKKPLYIMPHLLTPFIGREQEVKDVSTRLMRSTVRLVTLLGIGGIGKTRLAIQVATGIRNRFADGVCFVSLAAVREPDQVFQTIMSTLTTQKSTKRSPFEQVKHFLHEKRILLVLDNFEQAMDAAPLIEELVSVCAYLKILVTSREVLHLQVENHFDVPQLQLPDLARLPELDAFIRYPSVALFVHYAQTHQQAFRVTPRSMQAVAELCVRLDGLPLAIELAASRIKLLPPPVLLKRLSQRLRLLKSDLSTVSERHRTLYDTMKWSYDLLNTQEQWLFRQLSIFAGGASLETIEHFFSRTAYSVPDILDIVYSLVDKSLLYCDYEEDDCTVRIMMLETTREFGRECLLVNDECEQVASSHAIHYLRMIEEAANYLKGAQQDIWLQKMKRELVNLRTALEWLIGRQETLYGLRFCEAFGKFCGLYGYWSEERRWLQAALELPQHIESKGIRARVLRRAGHLAYRLRDFITAQRLQEESVMLSREVQDTQNLAGALSGLGWILHKQNDHERAEPLLRESVEVARLSSDVWSLANTLESLGRFMHWQGRTSEAYAYLEESLALARSLQDKETAVRILKALVGVEIALGNSVQAVIFARESLELAQTLGTTPLLALALDTLGDVAFFKGTYKQARKFFEKSIALARKLGDEPAIESRQRKLVEIALLQEDTQNILTFVQEQRNQFYECYDVPGRVALLARCESYLQERRELSL